MKRQLVDSHPVRDGQVVNALVRRLVRQQLPHHDTVAVKKTFQNCYLFVIAVEKLCLRKKIIVRD